MVKLALKPPPEWGTEPVPAEKRVLRSIDYFILWSSLAVGLLVLEAGGLLVGLLMPVALAIALLGSVIGSVMLALAGGLGSKYGIPTMVSLRGVLGLRGSYLPTALNVIQLISWAAFEILVMAESARSISGGFLGPYTTYFWVFFFAAWCMLMSLGGPLTVIRQWLEKFAIWLVYGTAAFITYIILCKAAYLPFQVGEPMPVGLALDLVIAMPISWWPLISDYNRFSKSEKGAFIGTTTGYAFTNFWFYALGILLIGYIGGSAISAITSITFGGLALAILLVDETDNGFADIYSAAVSIQNVSPKSKQRKIIIAVTVVSVIMVTLMPGQWQLAYQDFLIYIGAVFVPLLGVFAMDFYIIKKKQYKLEEFYASAKRFRIKPAIAWFIGIVAYFILYFYTAIGSSILSFVVSALVLYILEKAS